MFTARTAVSHTDRCDALTPPRPTQTTHGQVDQASHTQGGRPPGRCHSWHHSSRAGHTPHRSQVVCGGAQKAGRLAHCPDQREAAWGDPGIRQTMVFKICCAWSPRRQSADRSSGETQRCRTAACDGCAAIRRRAEAVSQLAPCTPQGTAAGFDGCVA